MIPRLRPLAFALVATFGTLGTAHAIDLRSGFGGPAGYGALVMQPNDDGSSSRLNLPFSVNFFGASYSNFWANNNGNISFSNSISTFTPSPFPVASQPMIAPYWGDVDTRGAGAVYVAAPNADSVVVTWNNVGYYNSRSDRINDFQLTLLNRPDTGAGNFDIEFRYRQLQWTTGNASGGSNGLGGTPAQAGYDAGNQKNFFTLPGSRTSAVLDLATTSNVSTTTPGLWTMAIRNGTTSDGSSASAPLLPVIVNQGGFQFDFDIQLNQRIFIDPIVAVGYDYVVSSGPNILTAVFPAIPGDSDGYQVRTLADALLGTVMPGDVFDFGPLGVSGFRLSGIDPGALLDPSNPVAFVTGLSFVSAGTVQMSQNPITFDYQPNGQVPVPAALPLIAIGLGALGLVGRRRVGAA